MRRLAVLATALLLTLPLPSLLRAHCEIPCGIYDDHLRVHLIEEHITTIEKAMSQIDSLSAQGDKNYNQLIRWTMNKEDHANQLQEIVSQYFMTQRVKPASAQDAAAQQKYVQQLTVLHQLLVSAMKAKQSLDRQHVADLREQTARFEKLYFGQQGQ